MIWIRAAWAVTAVVPTGMSMEAACLDASVDRIEVTSDIADSSLCTIDRAVTIVGDTETGDWPAVPSLLFVDGSEGSTLESLSLSGGSPADALSINETDISGTDLYVGGHLRLEDGTAVFERIEVVNANGAGISVQATADTTRLSLTECDVHDNADGGIVAQGNTVPITIYSEYSIFYDNIRSGAGGAILADGVDVLVEDVGSSFYTNKSEQGGAIMLDAASAELKQTSFEDNHAFAGSVYSGLGSAIAAFGGSTVTCTGCTFLSHTGDGPALYANASELTLIDSSMLDNSSSSGSPGALQVANGVSTSITGSMFCGNVGALDTSSAMSASSARLDGGIIDLVTTTFSANDVSTPGAALVLRDFELAELQNLTFVHNAGGAALHSSGGDTLSVVNTVFDNNVSAYDLHSEDTPETASWSWIRWVGDEPGSMSATDSETLDDAEWDTDLFTPRDCETYPIPGATSPLLGTGDPEIMASQGIDWIGAYDADGPDTGDTGSTPDTADPDTGESTDDTGLPSTVSWYSGGCRSTGALVLLLLLVRATRDADGG